MLDSSNYLHILKNAVPFHIYEIFSYAAHVYFTNPIKNIFKTMPYCKRFSVKLVEKNNPKLRLIFEYF